MAARVVSALLTFLFAFSHLSSVSLAIVIGLVEAVLVFLVVRLTSSDECTGSSPRFG